MKMDQKITLLRKQMNLSQEELAYKLNVSRQAVSKWETGESTPEIDKIVLLSEVFNVSLDYLIKDNQEISHSNNSVAAKLVNHSEADEFLRVMNKAAKLIAVGVGLLILAAIIPIVVFDVLNGVYNQTLDLVVTITLIFALGTTAIALFIFSGIRMAKFQDYKTSRLQLSNDLINTLTIEANKKETGHLVMLITGVALLIFGAAPLISMAILDLAEKYVQLGLAIFLGFGLIAIGLLIITGINKSSYNILLQKNDYSVDSKTVDKRSEAVQSIFWLVIVATYLAISFITHRWDTTWIIWPIAGLTSAIISRIIDLTKK